MNALITYGDSHLSLGTLVGLPAGILVTLALSALVWLFGRNVVFDSYGVRNGDWQKSGPRVCAAVTIVIGLIGCAAAMYPYSGQYHHWQEVSGTVTSTNSRFLAAKGGADQKFVVTFAGSGQQFGCNDTRCATVSEGDDLTITCKRVFQWFGTPGYDCNFVSYKQASQ